MPANLRRKFEFCTANIDLLYLLELVHELPRGSVTSAAHASSQHPVHSRSSGQMSNSATTKTKSSPKPHRALKDGRKLRPVGSVMNAIRVLRYLAQSGRGEGATQVAKAVEMYPGTCYQLFRTLVQDDLLHFDPVEKKYSLSSGLRDFVATSETAPSDGFPLKRREHMKELSRRFTATVYLYRPASA